MLMDQLLQKSVDGDCEIGAMPMEFQNALFLDARKTEMKRWGPCAYKTPNGERLEGSNEQLLFKPEHNCSMKSSRSQRWDNCTFLTNIDSWI